MGNGIDGSGKRRTLCRERRVALAAGRKCPKCHRGAALSRYDDGVISGSACRWCDYTNLREKGTWGRG